MTHNIHTHTHTHTTAYLLEQLIGARHRLVANNRVKGLHQDRLRLPDRLLTAEQANEGATRAIDAAQDRRHTLPRPRHQVLVDLLRVNVGHRPRFQKHRLRRRCNYLPRDAAVVGKVLCVQERGEGVKSTELIRMIQI